ncbi:methyltransferase domain-containing protein [Pseudoroseomonas ludipueritiae]|uniref:Methyltransferase domain-containing protein n=1 Tax=Pseudoroseomonas ludipueritiae TaxID=198093 RepID=A0ABR7RCY3_9PROT|nr:methyltransferase domain-containing protein [Pseudoroseomonas ludipueritiae]MBC9179295.1 methyltransferase domain-containing protein [Pseudoroseomonas ludipueritiae]
MTRKQRVLRGLDPANAVGIEVGALCRPLVTRAEGRIIYVDHTDTASLRAKYAGDPNVDIDAIVEVDAVWGNNTLADAVGTGTRVDYVVASHLIEHVPDLLGWLGEVHGVLKPQGSLRLVVPDRRFTFDHARQETRLSDALYAFLVRARAPLLPFLLDYVLEVVEFDVTAATEGRPMRRLHDLPLALAVAEDVQRNGTYHDAHCWVFTPASFAALMERAAALGLMRFSCHDFHDTAHGENEFTVALQPCDDPAEAAGSWRRMAGQCADAAVQQKAIDIAALRTRLAVLEAQHAEALQELEAMRTSRSWQWTAPLRHIGSR